jgi:hypothetical protein
VGDAVSTGYRWDADIDFAAAVDLTPLRWTTVEDYGVVGDGVADDTDALNAASAAAKTAGGGLYLPPWTYRITDTFSVETNFQATGATLDWDGGDAGVALSLGSGTAIRTQDKRMFLPTVLHTAGNFTGWDIGIRVWSLSSSQVFFSTVSGFSVAILFTSGPVVAGEYGPTQYNSYFLGQTASKVPIRVEGGASWNNENSYHGGSLSVLPGTEPVPWPGARNLQIRLAPTPIPAATRRTDSTGSQVTAGEHFYVFTSIDVDGYESPFSWAGRFMGDTSGMVTNDSTHTSNTITVPALSAFNIPGYRAAASINLYRTTVGNPVQSGYLGLVASGLTPSSSYIDTTPDASLGAHPPLSGLPNHHRFRDISAESGGQSEYAIECEGENNLFSWLRYEWTPGPPAALFNGSNATYNTIEGGAYSNILDIAQTNGAGKGNMLNPVGGEPALISPWQSYSDADLVPELPYRYHSWSPTASRAVDAPSGTPILGQRITFDIENAGVSAIIPVWDAAFVLARPLVLAP